MNPVKVRNLEIGVGMPKICVPIVEKSKDEIITCAKKILEIPVDLVEWRVDWFEDAFDIEEVKAVLTKLRAVLGEVPLLFTFRTKAEGGDKEIPYEQYAKLLKCVATTGDVELIDVEVFLNSAISTLIADIQKQGVKVIGSNHDFKKTPEKLEIIRRMCHMQVVGVDISKIAVMPRNQSDVLVLLDATMEMKEKYADRPIVTMSMSEMGVLSRISGETFGSSITFGAMGRGSAPGQIEVRNLREILEILHQVQ